MGYDVFQFGDDSMLGFLSVAIACCIMIALTIVNINALGLTIKEHSELPWLSVMASINLTTGLLLTFMVGYAMEHAVSMYAGIVIFGLSGALYATHIRFLNNVN